VLSGRRGPASKQKGKENTERAATLTSDCSIALPKASVHADERVPSRRRITPEAGHALEVLGHAIEYLTEEFVESGAEFSARNAQLEAVRMLMGLNRQVYFECPVLPTLGQKIRAALHLHTA